MTARACCQHRSTRVRPGKGVSIVPFRNVFPQLLTEESTIAWVVFGLVALTMLTALVLSRWRRQRGREPSKRMEANKLEIGYLAVLSGIVGFLMFTSLAGNSEELPASTKPALRVQVTGFQW